MKDCVRLASLQTRICGQMQAEIFFFVMSQDTVCSLMSRATTTHVEERESELALQRLGKKDEPGERSSERWQRFLAQHKSCCVVHVS